MELPNTKRSDIAHEASHHRISEGGAEYSYGAQLTHDPVWVDMVAALRNGVPVCG